MTRAWLPSRGGGRPGTRPAAGPRRASWAALALAAALVCSVCAADTEVTSYFQARVTADDGPAVHLGLRRLKLTVEGGIGRDASYLVQGLYKTGNNSATDGRVYLQEALVRLRAGDGTITVGQFKPPFGMERFTPDWDLASIDRSPPTPSSPTANSARARVSPATAASSGTRDLITAGSSLPLVCSRDTGPTRPCDRPPHSSLDGWYGRLTGASGRR